MKNILNKLPEVKKIIAIGTIGCIVIFALEQGIEFEHLMPLITLIAILAGAKKWLA